jgi:WD40 repeat protein
MNPGVDLHLAQVPYLGLRPFEVDEADIFFGRERQTDELLRRLSQTYFLPIVGPSGCGKSSLVRAGLLASLESGFIVEAGGRWRILTMMPRDRPIEELANAILRRLSEPDESKLIALQAVLRSGPRGLIEALKEIPVAPGENLLLLVDQFEEIFRFRDQLASRVLTDGAGPQDQKRKDEADAFVTLLLEAVKEKAAYVVLTMRSDFLRDCSLFAGLPEAFNRSIYLTPRLDRDDLQSAIQEPARVLGGSLQPDLVRQLINDARSNQDQLPLMQHVLMRMWSDVVQKRPDAPPELTVEDYGRVGALSKALCQDADNAFDKELSPEQQRIAEVMFKALCVRGSSDRDTRAPARLDHVAKVAEVKWEDVVPVVEVFRGAGRYFLSPRSGPLAPDTVLDITHESLIRNWKRLSQWVEEEALSAETYQRLIRDAVDWKEGGDLLSPIRLSSLNAWEKRFHPTEPWSQRYGGQFALATEYLQASRKQREKEAQDAALAQQKLYLKENAIKKLGIALGVAVLVVGWAIYQTKQASDQAYLANQHSRFAIEQKNLAIREAGTADANYGSALFIKAQLEWRSQKALSAWPYAVAFGDHNKDLPPVDDPPEPAIRYYRQIRHQGRVAALAISPDGKTLVAALNDGSIDLVDPQTGSLRNLPAVPSEAEADAQPSATVPPITGKGETGQLTISPDGKRLYFLRRGFGLEVRSLPDGKPLPLPEVFPNFPAAARITSFAMNPNGAFALGVEGGRLIYSPDGSSIQDVRALAPTRQPGKLEISYLAFSADGKTIAGIGGGRKELHVWQVGNGGIQKLKVEPRTAEGDSQPTRLVQLSAVLFIPATSNMLMLASTDGRIDLASLLESSSSPGENPAPSASPSKTTRDKTAKSTASRTNPDPAPPQSESVAENTLGITTIASLAPPESNEVELSALSQSAPARESSKPAGNVTVAIDPSGEGIFWVTENGRLNVWWPGGGIETGSTENSRIFVKAHVDGATALAVSPSGSWLATGGGDNTTRIWRITAMETLARAAAQTAPEIETVAIDPGGTIVAIGGDSFGMRVMRTNTVQPFPDLEPGKTHNELYLSPDGKSVVVGFDQTVHILDAGTLQERTRIEGVSHKPFGFNGSILASPKSEGELEVTLWDASTGKELGNIPAAKDDIVDIMFGSAGRDLVAIAPDKNRLTIWDIHDPAQPRELRSMSTGLLAIELISFAASENAIAAAGSDAVIVFDAKTASLLTAIPVSESPGVMTFNASGALLALGFRSEVKVWDCNESRGERTSIRGSTGFARALAFTSSDQVVTAGKDCRVRVWGLDGKLVRTLRGRDWRPKTPDDAARLSGLKLENLEVRFLTPKEEEDLHIDAADPLDPDGLGEYWRALQATTRDFATLEKTRELQPEAIGKADHLARWLDAHKESSDVGTRSRIKNANERHKSLVLDLANSLRSQALEHYELKHYDLALTAVTEAITLEKAGTEASNVANETLTDSMKSLLFLRGRILVAQHSPEARKDFQQIVDGAGPEPSGTLTPSKALAHLYLAHLDPTHLDAAESYCADQVKKYSSRSVNHYCLASVFAMRSTAPGADNNARIKDFTTAIESLKKGLSRRNYSLQLFVDSTPFLTPLAQDVGFKKLLSDEQALARKKSEAAAAK